MLVAIVIDCYVDTMTVTIDGGKLDTHKESFGSKTTFICDSEPGIHKIEVKKEAVILERSWKKRVAYDWFVTILDVEDKSIEKIEQENAVHTLTLLVHVESDMQIHLKASDQGIIILEKNDEIIDVHYKKEASEKARKRIRKAYDIPVFILFIVMELGVLALCIVSLIYQSYLVAALSFFLFALFLWLLWPHRKKRNN